MIWSRKFQLCGVFFQNPKERAVLLEYSKTSSAASALSTVDVKNARNRHLSEAVSPKKLPGSTLLPSTVQLSPVCASDQRDVGQFGSDHYLATEEVRSVAVCHLLCLLMTVSAACWPVACVCFLVWLSVPDLQLTIQQQSSSIFWVPVRTGE